MISLFYILLILVHYAFSDKNMIFNDYNFSNTNFNISDYNITDINMLFNNYSSFGGLTDNSTTYFLKGLLALQLYLYPLPEYEDLECYYKLVEAVSSKEGLKSIWKYLQISGISFGDFGAEYACRKEDKRKFLFVNYELEKNEEGIYFKQTNMEDLLNFLNITKYISGICVPEICYDFTFKILNKTKSNFYIFLSSVFQIKNPYGTSKEMIENENKPDVNMVPL